jgi:hypothetical protein
MVCHHWLIHRLFSDSIEYLPQTGGDYDPSFVTESLRENEHSDAPNQEIDLLKDIAAQTYMG